MRFALIVSTFLPLLHRGQTVCHACFGHICYTKQKLLEADLISGQIAIDRANNLLHLHYKKPIDYTSVIDLNDMTMSILPIQESFARAVDQKTGEVYLSSSRSIYLYNRTKQIEPFWQSKKHIWQMQFKDRLYYTEYENPGLFYFNNKTCVSILSNYVINDFIIDKNGDIYFTSHYLVYRLKKHNTNVELFSAILYSLTTDVNENAYFVDSNERFLYKLNYDDDTLEPVGMFEVGTFVLRMVFDGLNRIVFTDEMDDLYLLTPNIARCSLIKVKKRHVLIDY